MNITAMLSAGLLLATLSPVVRAAGTARASTHQRTAYTPRPGSAELRKAGRVNFLADHLKVLNGWAFFQGAPLLPSGQGHFSHVSALRRQEGRAWKLAGGLDPVEEPAAALNKLRARYPQAPAALFPRG